MEILNLSRLLNLINEVPEYSTLTAELRLKNGVSKTDVIEAARPYLIAALYQLLKRPVVVITAHAEESRKLYEQISIWSHADEVKLMPEANALPYERIVSDLPTELERLRVLSALANAHNGKILPLAVIPATALIQKTASFNDFAGHFHTLKEDSNQDPMLLMKRWQSLGYTVESTVEIPGTMSKRGGIIDIFPSTSELPARLEFFGNIVESIRLYDPANQRSVRRVPSINIGPATELLAPFAENGPKPEDILKTIDFSNCNEEFRQTFAKELDDLYRGQKTVSKEFYAPLLNQDSLLSYLPENTLLIIDEPLSVQRTIEDFDNKAVEIYKGQQSQGELPANFPRPYFSWDETAPALAKLPQLILSELVIS
jgi:transcription-repair coupling factor (superfamily II helicase)